MDRRNFLKLTAASSATVALGACRTPEKQLIRFIPEEEFLPGIATWKPGVCSLCAGGCGLKVRVMEGEAEVVRNGQVGLIKMGLAKKVEGSPDHPVNRGRLCARGQAGLQVTYNPDRLRFPLKRVGARGSGEFEPISWKDAIQELVSRLTSLSSNSQGSALAMISRPLRGQRRVLIDGFLAALSAQPLVTFELFDESALRRANWLSFGRYQLPTFDLARTNFVASFGADFLGTWNSPVAQGRSYGEMRQGRPSVRGRFAQIEPRMSQTGANADIWIPVRPGAEGLVALSLAHVTMAEQLRSAEAAGHSGKLIEGWTSGLKEYTPEAISPKSDIAPETIRRLARGLVTSRPAVVIMGGPALAHTNGLFNALAGNALNALLGNVDKPGGVYFTPQPPLPATGMNVEAPPAGHFPLILSFAQRVLSGQSSPPELLLLYEANVVFATPRNWRVREAIEKAPFIASFGSFLDETSILADLILPDHSYLESWTDDVAEAGSPQAVASLAPPVMLPLHQTRAMPDVLLDIARQMGGKVAETLPWKEYEGMLQAAFNPLKDRAGSVQAKSDDEFWSKAQEQGGWWSASPILAPTSAAQGVPVAPVSYTEPQFDGDEPQFPFHFLPYPSQQFLDGSLANLPWLQEMPDALTTVMWGTWVEINPQTAEQLGISTGDLVEVASQYGKIQAPALAFPGIATDMVSMPVGQGHTQFGRYASRRGNNPLEILAPLVEPTTGSLAWAATRVKIRRVGKSELALFSSHVGPAPHEGQR
jgi:anaerobic selenocysteine-containing dehydrogenase